MMPLAEANYSFRYVVLTFQSEDAVGGPIPIGVVLWSEESGVVRLRFMEPDERVKHLRQELDYPFIKLVRDKLEHWMQAKSLPYGDSMLPHQTEWWQHVRNLLIHQVRLLEPRPIDCTNPDEEIEPLYESIVGPYRSRRQQRDRVDGQIAKALSDLSEKFESKKEVPGFRNRPVRVLRSFKGNSGWVIVDGVNLASANAEKESDAVASRLGRVREALKEDCHIVVGYLSSPEGLNGEQVLVEWIERQTGGKAFDLTRQREKLRQAAGDLVAQAAVPRAD